jgi:hypothetical protein
MDFPMTRRRFKCNACGGLYWDLQADGSTYHHACAPIATKDPLVTQERSNKRDESITQDRDGDFAAIASEGAGVVCLDDQRLTEPAWVTQRKEQARKKWGEENA